MTDRDAARPPLSVRGPVPDRLGRYHLERVLGTGGMGVVYRAFDPELARAVALKVLRPGERDERMRIRLLGEARAMAQLAHPNVVAVHEVGSDGGHDFIVMELVEGTTLARWLDDTCPSRARIVEAFIAAGRGLAAAHAAGLIHRDFKPDNVLRALDGRIVVGDFGLARAGELADGTRLARGSQPRLTNGLCGTPAYMAPEQWRGDELSPATDQWAFCVALWEALVGKRPFEVTLASAATETWKLPTRVPIPRRLRRALARGLAADPADRWPTLDALLAELSAGPTPVFHVAGAAAVFGIAYALTSGGAADGAFECDAAIAMPAFEPGTLLEADATRALALRGQACAASRPRVDEVTCLDGVLARLVATRSSSDGEHLVDPHVCSAATPPRLHAYLAPASPTDDACPHATAWTARAGAADPEDRAVASASMALARLCGDARVIADAQLATLHHQVERARFRVVERSLEQTTDAIAAVEQPDLTGMLAVERARYAASRGAIAEQLRHLDTAIELLARRPALRAELMQQRIAVSRQQTPDEAARLQDELITTHAHRAHAMHDHDHDHDPH